MNRKIIYCLMLLIAFSAHSQTSMRRCSLLPVVDSVGGAIGFKVYQELENHLNENHWRHYVSNSSLVSVFSKYRENLPSYLKKPEVLKTVADKLKTGSLFRISLINEINGLEVGLDVLAENGEDVYFSEKVFLETDDIVSIVDAIKNWLELYAKMIPYDGKVTGILGDQITIDIGKGYPINQGQGLQVKRVVRTKKHPLLKKIVDWESVLVGEGEITTISDNQALGLMKNQLMESKIEIGDWVNLVPVKVPKDTDFDNEDKIKEEPGKLGIVSIGLSSSATSLGTSTPTGVKKVAGRMLGFYARGEGWVTKNYFGALEIVRTIGTLEKTEGETNLSKVDVTFSLFKLTGGYRYLPIGFFYGPQVDIYGGVATYTFDAAKSEEDGFGKTELSGLMAGIAAHVPINREYKILVRAEFLPFPKFKDESGIYGSAKSSSLLNLELGVKYQYQTNISFDGFIETLSTKSSFEDDYSEVSYHDNLKVKLGTTFSF